MIPSAASRSIIYDLVRTVRGTTFTRATMRPPFAICICPEKRHALHREIKSVAVIYSSRGFVEDDIVRSMTVHGALIGSISCNQADKT